MSLVDDRRHRKEDLVYIHELTVKFLVGSVVTVHANLYSPVRVDKLTIGYPTLEFLYDT